MASLATALYTLTISPPAIPMTRREEHLAGAVVAMLVSVVRRQLVDGLREVIGFTVALNSSPFNRGGREFTPPSYFTGPAPATVADAVASLPGRRVLFRVSFVGDVRRERGVEEMPWAVLELLLETQTPARRKRPRVE
jgi:hypothetical protein